MTIAPLSTPYGHTIFCDDIRFEINGKVTLVGIYAGDMVFGRELPATLPKFCLRIAYTERPNESTEPVQIRVYMPGEEKGRDEPSFKIDVARENVEQIPIVPLGDTDGEQLKTMVFHLSLEAVNVK